MRNEQKTLNIEVWDFWKLLANIDGLTQAAVKLDMKIHLIYHAEREAGELLKISALEEAVKQCGQPYDISILFDAEKPHNAPYRCSHI